MLQSEDAMNTPRQLVRGQDAKVERPDYVAQALQNTISRDDRSQNQASFDLPASCCERRGPLTCLGERPHHWAFGRHRPVRVLLRPPASIPTFGQQRAVPNLPEAESPRPRRENNCPATEAQQDRQLSWTLQRLS